MKKTIIASSLAVGLGVVAGNAGHDAHASEANINEAELAQKAQSNDQSLNESPIQEGAYNYTFDYNGFTYHFESDGSNFSWDFHQSGQSSEASNTQAQPQQDVSEQASASTNQTSAEEVSNQQQSNSAQPEQVSAPQTEQTQQPQQEATTSNNESSSNEASSGSSVNVNDHLKQIAQRESGGDIHATNPSTGASGKYQFLQSTWDSVAPSEYKGQPASSAPEHVQDTAAQKLYDTAGPSQWVTA
ncbi:MAG: transglycosylase family protein [Staphylococcus warneri]|uniref:transglycosylase family protein n=1 Tax=Staphylococcus warneri TaxID=1292 RepID=UPI0009A4F4B6|nr:transglycosylase family protein [Staphylococcus warneri]MCM3483742.1 transglycosylase family protein [Staphylococcus warneri]MCR4501986.1 transglycosylase family protein [Staphylococcus warneri]MCT1633702.1 transglycosylase family protein [Staphylococcus warneri]MCT2349775.1 transglycosylase family protein [Staphylococcus warneri]MCV7475901.1 transglycosylase family protein [Staphylococcus warneri]